MGKYKIDGCFSAIPYTKTAQKLIYNFKYKPYLSDLADFLSSLMYESLSQNEDLANALTKSKNWQVVPIPLYKSKLKKRGYNQSEILAKNLAKKFGFKFSDSLIRILNTKTQVGLKPKERQQNIKGAFKVKNSLKNEGVLLVDDVVTTGSTLMEAARMLKRSGVLKVIGITLARD